MMDSLRRGLARVASFFRKGKLDGELDAEVASHIEMATEDNVRSGMTPEEARRKALVSFGGVEQAKERQREARGLPWLDVLMQDLRFTLRTLRRERGFTVVAVLILALGIGTNVVVFSVVNTMMLRPLPFRDPQRLVWIAGEKTENKCGLSCMTYSADAYDDLVAMNRSYQDVTGYFAFSTPDNFKLMGRGEPTPLTAIAVVYNFFPMLSVQPEIGRSFTAKEAVKGAPGVVMLSHAFWKRQFGGDRSILGKAITLNGGPSTVVGVLPESFDFGAVFSPGAKVDAFVPVAMDGDIRDWGNTLALIGRLKPGVSVEQARAEAKMLFPKLYWSKKRPESVGGYTAWPVMLKEYVSGKLRRSLIVLWSAVGLILLIVCVNLSNLLLARAAARSKEFALRSALGAARWRLVRQLLTESLVLAGAGAVLGLGLAYAITRYLAHQGSIALPLLSSVRVDGASLGWTLLITVGAAVMFGLLPGLRMSAGGNLQEALKDAGPGMSDGRKHERLRSALVISEVALACVLLVGAGLLLRSFLRVLDVDLGFEPSTAATIKVDYDYSASPEKRSAILQNVIAHVSAIPGVEVAGISDNLPLERNRSWGAPRVKGKVYRDGDLPGTFVYIVSPGYLRAMGMRLHGRDFSWQDTNASEKVIILNATAAKGLFPGEDAVGRIVMMNQKETRVVGVIDDIHESNVEGKAGWQMYMPLMQETPNDAYLVVRTKLPPAQLAGSVMRTLRELNPNQSAVEFRPVQGIVDHAVSPRRFFVLLVSIFAGLGLVLASLGIYGVISYSVTRRTQEIGVRMALGATPERVQRHVIWNTLQLALGGIAVGVVASVVVANLIASLLFGTNPTDPPTFGGMIALLTGVAALAGYVPARRASRINPMVALRNE